jgi:ATP-dependent Lhr-like helicase
LLRQASASTIDRYSSIDAQHAEPIARQLLRRYGVVFRDLLARESLVQSWRDLLVQYRRMELQGEIRGGRFVSGFTGEQFALPEAVESLRAARKRNVSGAASHDIKLSASDPLNSQSHLAWSRVPAVPSNFVVFRDGVVVRAVLGREAADRPNEQTDWSERTNQVRQE